MDGHKLESGTSKATAGLPSKTSSQFSGIVQDRASPKEKYAVKDIPPFSPAITSTPSGRPQGRPNQVLGPPFQPNSPQASQRPLPSLTTGNLPAMQQPDQTAGVANRIPTSSQPISSVPTFAFPEPGPSGEATPLDSVLVPAIRASLDRRIFSLNDHFKKSLEVLRNKALTNMQINAIKEADRQREARHELMVKHVTKLTGVLSEIDKIDREVIADGKVGMGGGVNMFLEGFLEELLVRIEAEDEVPSPAKKR